VKKLVVLYFILINLTGFALALLDGSDVNVKAVESISESSDIRMTTMAAFGASTGIYLSYQITDNSNALKNQEFKGALQILILQNILFFLFSLKSCGRKRKSADYNRSSLSLK
jgi:uncharacterized membrane protein YsdA (DUF1294 family)